MWRLILKWADFFLPSDCQIGERRSRARTSIFLFLISIVLVSLTTLLALFKGNMLPIQASVYGIALCFMTFNLILIKKTRLLEWITVGHLCIIGLIATVDSVFVSRSLFTSSLQSFPLALLFGFFVCPGWKHRTVLASWYLACTLFCFMNLRETGFTIPYGMDQEKFVNQLVVATAAKAVIALLTVNFYIRVKSIAEEDLEKELNWQIQSLKLGEISFMTKLLLPQLERPFANFRRELKDFEIEKNLAFQSEDFMKRIRSEVETLTRTAQSLTWIYKAYRNEQVGRTNLKVFESQLVELMRRKAEDSGTELDLNLESTGDQVLEGPLPTVLLLLLTLSDQLIKPKSGQVFKIYLSSALSQSSVHWRIRKRVERSHLEPEANSDHMTEHRVQKDSRDENDLFEELAALSDASVKIYQEGEDEVIEISGPWLAREGALSHPPPKNSLPRREGSAHA